MIVVQAACHMVWADARLSPSELSAVRGVATVLGLDEQARGLLSKGPMPPSKLALSSLPEPSRRLTYATLVWIALADGVLDANECRVLNSLREDLELDTDSCAAIENLVFAASGGSDAWAERYAKMVTQL